MVEKAGAVKGLYKSAAAALLGSALALAGCSLPGMSFKGPPKAAKSNVAGYKVQAITPNLLAEQQTVRESASVAKTNAALQTAISDYTYHVQAQDVISVTVWGHPEFSPSGRLSAAALTGGSTGGLGSSVGGGLGAKAIGGVASPPGEAGFTVQADGTIFFPYVGAVEVAGLTVPQIRDKMAQELSKYVVDPQVSVSVVGFNSQTYQLAGAVRNPGLYPITNVPITISQAIQKAGGALRTNPNVTVGARTSALTLADLAHVLYVHDGKREVLDMRAFFQNGDEAEDRLLQPGDIVQVPDNAYDQVHLIGEVNDPGDYSLDNGQMNLAEALGKAGGVSLVTSNPSRIFVFRGTYAQPEIFWLDARSPVAMLLAAQFQLQPQDVVYVATAGVSTWNRIITQILPTVQVLNYGKQITK